MNINWASLGVTLGFQALEGLVYWGRNFIRFNSVLSLRAESRSIARHIPMVSKFIAIVY